MKLISIVHRDTLREADPEAKAVGYALARLPGVCRCAITVPNSALRAPLSLGVARSDLFAQPIDIIAETWIGEADEEAETIAQHIELAIRTHMNAAGEIGSALVRERTMRRDVPRGAVGRMPHVKLAAFMTFRRDLAVEDIDAIWLEHGEAALRTMPPFELYQQNIVLKQLGPYSLPFDGMGAFGFLDYDGFLAWNQASDPEREKLAKADFERWVTGSHNLVGEEFVAEAAPLAAGP